MLHFKAVIITWTILPCREHLSMSGDIFKLSQMSVCVLGQGWGTTTAYWVEARDAAKYTGQPPKNYLTKNFSSTEVEKSHLRA